MSNLVDSLETLYRKMTYKYDHDRVRTFHGFLDKFNIQNHIRWTEDAIDASVKQVVEDMWEVDKLDYCELRFSIDKYLNYIPWDEQESCLFVLERIRYWEKYFNHTKIAPVISIKYESAFVNQKRVSKLINHWRIAEQLAGIDMVGNEAMFNRKRLRDIYRYWRACGKGLLAHAGESQGPENIRMAIEDLGVSRVAHGIRIVEDLNLMKLAIDKGIVFDIAITSNLLTGAVKQLEAHPIKQMLDAGCIITIGTDDPVTFCTTLNHEYDLAAIALGISNQSDVITYLKCNSITHALQI